MKIFLILVIVALTACKNQMQSTAAGTSSKTAVESTELPPAMAKEKAYAETQIFISDLNGRPVSGALVSGQWSGIVSSSASATTDLNGIAIVRSLATEISGPINFQVNTVTKIGSAYDPTKNKIIKVSLLK